MIPGTMRRFAFSSLSYLPTAALGHTSSAKPCLPDKISLADIAAAVEKLKANCVPTAPCPYCGAATYVLSTPILPSGEKVDPEKLFCVSCWNER